jgi:hypothetical protein
VTPDELPMAIPTHLPEGVWPGGYVVRLYATDGTVLLEQLIALGDPEAEVIAQAVVMYDRVKAGDGVMVSYDGDTGALVLLASSQ